MADHSYFDADSEFNWLQFLDNHEMQPLVLDNLFAYKGLMDDNFSTPWPGLPPNLPQQTTRIGCSEILPPCLASAQNVPQQNDSAITNRSNIAGIERTTCALPAFLSGPAFAEPVVKYSSFATEHCQNAEESAPCTASVNKKERAFEDAKYIRMKKRKSLQKAANSEAAKGKRRKDSKPKEEQSDNDVCGEKSKEENNAKVRPPPPEKLNYVHVRARRGQATDSHSLAERVRRKKINERMKLLQDLVPGCSKITGRALMLDEIIDYIQSLHRQVEALSIMLASVNPVFDFDVGSFC